MITTLAELLFAFLIIAAILTVHAGSVAWALRDAQKRGQSGGFIVVLFWLFGPLSALLWLVIRPRTTVVERPVTTYSNAEDALEAAAKLDQLGEWDPAIASFENVAERWPQHSDYVSACIKQIQQKQELSR